ncbi:UDP-N-acetylmuramoyl-L-alanine--D-glutamate ligase [Lentisphaera profundi]|uniref:UDP-N-acetylmuramoylalanine--D-glutamate ligase n=1 Tax=Lentisphaera profundi TaxID=1658616 RepID=A0ABY7VW84_9BACT|nr:UDP-N-acetylmuramoyl-L-alanine--D-glutamate ligase [Lentisphaera profundi]WDE97091.1 UDP-N-acetylmuramoyl-L-alanine--D-glutamate ligase [Lentisphaera profundi]
MVSRKTKKNEVLVCGLGKSGVATARLALAKGLKVSLCDSASGAFDRKEVKDLLKAGAQAQFLPILAEQRFEVCVMSPGVNPLNEIFKEAKKYSELIMGDLDFAAQFMPNTKFLAITGTNGKTTCAEMLEYSLLNLGLNARACGNIGIPLAELALLDNQPEYALIEISSYQIDLLYSLEFEAAVILNISEDHIDRYGDFKTYYQSKMNIEKFSKILILQEGLKSSKQAQYFSNQNEIADFAIIGDDLSINKEQYKLPHLSFYGAHNRENALAALALMSNQKINIPAALQALSTFTCSEHRLEECGQYSEVLYINDSKSTNPASLAVALESFAAKNKKIVLIAGGRDKNMDLSVVNPLISKYVRKVFSYGECKNKLKTLWQAFSPVKSCSDFDTAVLEAIKCSTRGDVVLLSPGCSSLDLFKSYEERGRKFKSLVQKVNE